jgi:hypothetical protein
MKNIVYTEEGIQVQVTYLDVYEEKVYVLMRLYNNTDSVRQFIFSYLFTNRPEYYSQKHGVKEFLGVLPNNNGDIYYKIKPGFFLELQFVFNCWEINDGDVFDLHGYFDLSFRNINYHFRYKDNQWTVLTSIAGTKDRGPEEFETLLEFKKNEVSNHSVQDPLKELDSLIGLSSVKEEVKTLANFIRIQKIRIEKGLPSADISYHCVFTGNPGTGKTTVARIVAGIYKEMGILKKGHIIETDRSGLVAGYIGQTAIKTNQIIDSALDGVLFIDEAYSLANKDNTRDFGAEAISTLLKRMEDDRDRLVVIVAGYTKEMKDFINSNSGLKSRFVRYINFPDYSSDELYMIFESYLSKGGYILEDSAKGLLHSSFEAVLSTGDRNYGNGRYVRNLYEEAIKAQANRLSSFSDVSDSDLAVLSKKDIEIGLERAAVTN